MIECIDHIVIRTPNAYETMKEIENIFGLVAHDPVRNYIFYDAGIIRLAGLEIEVLAIGSDKNFLPYFHGIAFKTPLSKWQLATKLNQLRIAHTFPVYNLSVTPGMGWTSTYASGFLDNPLSAFYLTGMLVGSNVLARTSAAILNQLTKSAWVRSSSSNSFGHATSMFQFVHYDNEKAMNDLRLRTDKQSDQRSGGRFSILETLGVEIEANESSMPLWQRLSQPKSDMKLALYQGKESRIRAVRLGCQNVTRDNNIHIGNARFTLTTA